MKLPALTGFVPASYLAASGSCWLAVSQAVWGGKECSGQASTWGVSPERADVVQHPEGAAMGGDRERILLRHHREIVDRHVWQVELQRSPLPPPSVD